MFHPINFKRGQMCFREKKKTKTNKLWFQQLFSNNCVNTDHSERVEKINLRTKNEYYGPTIQR
jgi:hypothetical protein